MDINILNKSVVTKTYASLTSSTKQARMDVQSLIGDAIGQYLSPVDDAKSLGINAMQRLVKAVESDGALSETKFADYVCSIVNMKIVKGVVSCSRDGADPALRDNVVIVELGDWWAYRKTVVSQTRLVNLEFITKFLNKQASLTSDPEKNLVVEQSAIRAAKVALAAIETDVRAILAAGTTAMQDDESAPTVEDIFTDDEVTA